MSHLSPVSSLDLATLSEYLSLKFGAESFTEFKVDLNSNEGLCKIDNPFIF